VARTYKTEAVVLRSIRFGEADRVLHLYTLDRGRIGAVAKGVRKTTSRFGARLEPLSHVELMLHQGSGELQTVTGVHLVAAHHAAREDSFQLKLLWLSGYLPHLTSCAECGAADATLVGYSPRAGGAVCGACAAQAEALALSPAGIQAIETLLATPLADAAGAGLSERSSRDALRLVQASYEYHGGFRLRTLSA
jgi:DNA repair protein RecO (recombination protein O)